MHGYLCKNNTFLSTCASQTSFQQSGLFARRMTTWSVHMRRVQFKSLPLRAWFTVGSMYLEMGYCEAIVQLWNWDFSHISNLYKCTLPWRYCKSFQARYQDLSLPDTGDTIYRQSWSAQLAGPYNRRWALHCFQNSFKFIRRAADLCQKVSPFGWNLCLPCYVQYLI